MQTHVQCHTAELLGDTGIWILVAGGAPLVSLPAAVWPSLVDVAQAWTMNIVEDPAKLQNELERHDITRVQKIIGPALIGYCAAALPPLVGTNRTRQLRAVDQHLVTSLQAACSSEEWEHGGSDDANECRFGAFDEQGHLVALAGYEIWNADIAHIAIISHPQRRGQGFALRAVHHAATHALEAGLLPQYRTLKANTTSIAIAQHLGFTEYGFSMYVRLGAA